MKQNSRTVRIGKYIIQEVIGHGGMGSVYRALSPETGRSVALKLLNPSSPLAGIVDASTLRELFSAEAQIMARLNHANIVEILDFDFDKGRPFYTMEFFCNNLGLLIGERYIIEERSRPVPPEKAVDYVCQVLNGLECLHRAGIIHRDIKPYNMLLTAGDCIKICDFGMAKAGEDKPLKVKGINIGSPYYTAPEQISSPGSADERSDLYSAGVLLYRMLTGELPAMKEFMLSRVDPLYSEDWDAFFARALSWDPAFRYQNAREMALELGGLKLQRDKKKEKICAAPPLQGAGQKDFLRHGPVRISGAGARQIFGVDELWQPQTLMESCFRIEGKDTFLDEGTGLTWQQLPSDYPLDRIAADEYITTLNEVFFGGSDSWRLPTVNELLSLIRPHAENADNLPLPASGTDWYWSCDRRSRETSWYVNTSLGFAGWQHDYCLYAVRAVFSPPN